MHLSEELAKSAEKVEASTQFGTVHGRRSVNGCAVFLGNFYPQALNLYGETDPLERPEIPFALPPKRFTDPQPLPSGFRYPDDHEYILESRYGAQPTNDGQAAGTLPADKLGLGEASENPLFLNIVCPPEFPAKGLQVRVYIHGGFLQFGSPHGLSSQAQYISALKNEIWVNIGYRLSVFGFLGNDNPFVSGNFGFKDQWLGLEWVRKNISAFGGDPNTVILSGLSAGAHSVHQLLHYASHLPAGIKAPFTGAMLQSNSLVNDPKTPLELHAQFDSLAKSVNLEPTSPDVLAKLSDPSYTSWQSLVTAIEGLTPYGTFRGSTDGTWMPSGAMAHQASPAFATGLKDAGVNFIVVGDLKEEWYLYSIAHPIPDYESISENLKRYYPDDIVERILLYYGKEGTGDQKGCEKLFGRMLSDGQVHLPVRILHRDLVANGFPVLRYQINWTPEQRRPFGYVTHGGDRVLWAYREDMLNSPSQLDTGRRWLTAIDEEIIRLLACDQTGVAFNNGDTKRILTLREDQSVGYEIDAKWDDMMALGEAALPQTSL